MSRKDDTPMITHDDTPPKSPAPTTDAGAPTATDPMHAAQARIAELEQALVESAAQIERGIAELARAYGSPAPGPTCRSASWSSCR
jgi:hypothetical protein